ncbi:MAG: DsbA family protein [Saprospiraceae bacterium]
MTQAQTTLIYIGDPMCSWCYGFSPEFTKAAQQLTTEGDVSVKMIMGGLRPYNTQKMPELSDFLKGHWEEVGERSGQPFSYDILQSKDFVYDTEPACRAVVVARELAPAKEWAFFKKVQAAFYYENQNTSDLATYLPIAKELGIDEKRFAELFQSDAMKQKTRADFTASAEMGVRGFPTVVLQKDGQLYLIANGYTEAENIVKAVRRQ